MRPAASIPDAYTSRPPVALDNRPATLPRLEQGMAPALEATAAPDGSIRCRACAHECLIRPGRVGICAVRENRHGRLISLAYGEAVAAVPELIEKKPLFHFRPGSIAYSIATRGCNFHCRFCQNWEIAQADREGIVPSTVPLSPREVVSEALRNHASSVAYTYVEPTVFLEYFVDTARLARAADLANVIVTNGYQTPEALRLIAPLVDAASVDLKSFSDRFYRRVCGARLAPVLRSIAAMRRLGIWVEITTLLIPDLNDDPAEVHALARWIVNELGPETPWHVSRFYPAYKMTDTVATPLATLSRAAAIGRTAGLLHVYLGNVASFGGADTLCPGCGAMLIRRAGIHVTRNNLVGGACPVCARPLAGVGLAEIGAAGLPQMQGAGAAQAPTGIRARRHARGSR